MIINEQSNISALADALTRSRNDDERVQLLMSIVNTLFGRKPDRIRDIMTGIQSMSSLAKVGQRTVTRRSVGSRSLTTSKMPKLKKLLMS
jgi:hypothetical protein